MGSKNLKAIAVRGSGAVTVADSDGFKAAVATMLEYHKESPLAYPVFSHTGSSLAVDVTTELAVFPANNWQDTGDTDWGASLGSKAFGERGETRNPCYFCPMGCSQVRLARHGAYAGISSEGPEYESIYSLGSVVGIADPDFVIAADKLCDQLGLDSISAGVTAAMAMELGERGLLADSGGGDLRFGDQAGLLAFLRQMAHREGAGAVFADGTRKAAERLGGDAAYYAMQVKGLELPAYDVRGLKAHGLNFATSYTGADHNRGYALSEVLGMPLPAPVERLAIEGKGALAKFNQDYCGAYDVPTLREFTVQIALGGAAQAVVGQLLTAVTGIEYSEADVWTLGERLNNLARMFNVREGFSRKDDTLPRRLMEEPIARGASKGELISPEQLNTMLDEYYAVRGWDADGTPTLEKLHELGLDFTVAGLPAK